jgi:hypothetical protein
MTRATRHAHRAAGPAWRGGQAPPQWRHRAQLNVRAPGKARPALFGRRRVGAGSRHERKVLRGFSWKNTKKRHAAR